jgi:hypothetical protein
VLIKNLSDLVGTGDMPGDLGFDPLSISSWVNLGFVQEAEIKHGRLAMLGLAGCFVETAGVKFPGVEKVFGTSTVSMHVDLLCRAFFLNIRSGTKQNVFELHNLAVEKVCC